MKNNFRVVLDSNVLISHAILRRSFTYQVAQLFFESTTILYSTESLTEFTRVLYRPKFDRYILNKERQAYLSKFTAVSEKIANSEAISACRDPHDDKFLEIAVNGNADLIVSGDEDLLVMKSFRGIDILSPREAQAWIEKSI